MAVSIKICLGILLSILFWCDVYQPQIASTTPDYIKASKDLYLAVRTKSNEASKYIDQLAAAEPDELKKQLDTEAKAKAFWINIYNSYVQYQLTRDIKLFENRSSFFQKTSIKIAGKKLSLDDIEHGIIRHSKNKLGLGYLGSFLVSDFEEQFRLDSVDYRIHFALNCGATSCPPITFYEATKLTNQLDKSTSLYLSSFAKYDEKDNVAKVPVLCLWFKADFDGSEGILKMLVKHKIIPAKREPSLEYLNYDWTLNLGNYSE